MIAQATHIPPMDEFGLPAAPWLFIVLMLVTLLLHLLFMNFALGGTLLAIGLNARALLRPAAREESNRITNVIAQMMPVMISFAITTGVAPLLFVQVLYGPYFYASTILLGFVWLSIIGLLIVGFYLSYVVTNRGANALLGRAGTWTDKPGRRLVVTSVAAACFVAIAWILTNNHVLSSFPDLGHWARDGHWRRNVAYAGHVSVLPRVLHMLIGAVAVAGVWLAAAGWWRRGRGPDDAETGASMIRLGLWVALIGSGVNIIAGVAFLFHHDLRTVAAMFRPNTLAGFLFAAGVFVLVPAHIVTLVLTLRQPFSLRMFGLAAAVLTVLALTMAIGREHLRLLHLARPEAGGFSLGQWAVRAQVSPLIVFLVVFVAGLATVGLVLRWMTERPDAGPPGASAGTPAPVE